MLADQTDQAKNLCVLKKKQTTRLIPELEVFA